MVYKIKLNFYQQDLGPKKPEQESCAVLWPQYLAAILATVGGLCSGNHLGWTSPTLPSITIHSGNATTLLSASTDPTNLLGLVTPEEAAWIASMMPLGATLGSLLVALFLVDTLGRKGCIMAMGLLFASSWALIACAHLIQLPAIPLYVGRFIGGLAAGGLTIVVPVYNEEVCVKEVRGRVGVLFDLSVNLGILTSYVAGGMMPYPQPWLAVLCATLPVIHLAAFCWLPETPVFLLRRGRVEQARRALSWFRSGKSKGGFDVDDEFDRLKATVYSDKQDVEQPTIVNLTDELKKRVGWVSAGIILGLMFFRPLSGINTVTFYSASIFKEAGSPLSPNLSSIVIGSVLVISNSLASRLVDRIGRRMLLLISLAGIVGSYILFVTYFCLKEWYPLIASFITWIPLGTIMLFVVSFSLGMGPLPWLIMAELLPVNSKKGSALYVSLTWFLSFLITYFFSDAVDQFGCVATYTFFLVCNVVAILFVTKFVPETKGKSRECILQEMAGLRK